MCQRCYHTRESYNEYHRQYRLRNKEKIRMYKREKQTEYRRERGSDPTGYLQAYAIKFPERKRAHSLVYQALQDRKLKKTPCEICGEVRVQGHHDDYTQPLSVRWLCTPCHRGVHKEQHHISENEKKELIKKQHQVQELRKQKKLEIVALYNSGRTLKEVGDKYGVSRQYIHSVVQKQSKK